MKLWLSAWTLATTMIAISTCEPSRALLSDWRILLAFVMVVIISPVLGFFLGVLAGSVMLPPLYELREWMNGGPFKTGDSVQILIGPYKGHPLEVDVKRK